MKTPQQIHLSKSEAKAVANSCSGECIKTDIVEASDECGMAADCYTL